MSEREVTFVEADRPAPPTGSYEITVTQTVNQPPPNRFENEQISRSPASASRWRRPEVAALFRPTSPTASTRPRSRTSC